MLNRKNLLAIITCVTIACVSATGQADELNFRKIGQQMQGLPAKTISLRRAAYAVPLKYSGIRSRLTRKADKLGVYVKEVSRGIGVIRKQPDNTKALYLAIRYSQTAERAADELESLFNDLKKIADRDDNDSLEKAARNYKKMADDVKDRMRRIVRELD